MCYASRCSLSSSHPPILKCLLLLTLQTILLTSLPSNGYSCHCLTLEESSILQTIRPTCDETAASASCSNFMHALQLPACCPNFHHRHRRPIGSLPVFFRSFFLRLTPGPGLHENHLSSGCVNRPRSDLRRSMARSLQEIEGFRRRKP